MQAQQHPTRSGTRFVIVCLVVVAAFACLFAYTAINAHRVADDPGRTIGTTQAPRPKASRSTGGTLTLVLAVAGVGAGTAIAVRSARRRRDADVTASAPPRA